MEYQITKKDKIIIKNFKNFINEEKPIIPIYQREFIEERINYFYNIIIKYVIKNKEEELKDYPVPFLNMIYCSKYENKVYILDGQHRYKAYLQYYNETQKDFNIIINVKECYSIDEIKEYFKELNNNFISENLVLEDNKIEKAKEIKLYMKLKYNKHLSNSEVPRYPNINLDSFCNYLINTFSDLTTNIIFEKMEMLNEEVKNYLREENNELYEQARRKQGFYLSYLFIKNENEQKRKKIPTSARHKLWRKYFNDKINGSCYVCNVDITIDNFHAGHIISVRNGGSNNINNLKVICSLCNLSMGFLNLEIFKDKYF
jgi:hypothetical protein